MTVREANMNPEVLLCKNCWKWEHLVGVCRIQESKCIKCNSPHQTVHYREFAWCCMANGKTNLPRLETKKGKPCPYSFKCLNCKGNYQANSMEYPFWKHCFNKEWYSKEYAKIQDNQKTSIRSVVNGNQS